MTWQPDYATPTELAAFVRYGGWVAGADPAEDTFLGLALNAASRAIDVATSRQFGNLTVSTARTYTAVKERGGRYIVDIDDVYDPTGLAVSDDGTPNTDHALYPLNAVAAGSPLTSIVFGGAVTLDAGGVTVTSDRWGWAAVPGTIKQATLLQASRLWKRRDAPFGVAGSPEMGSELRLLSKLDPDVQLLVNAFRRWWV